MNCGVEEDSRVPWTARRSNQSILKEISPEYSLEGLRLKLKFQYFGHKMQRANSLEKTLRLGKIEGRRRRGWQRTRWLVGITDSMDMSLSKLWEMVKNREACCAIVHEVTKNRTLLSYWTQFNFCLESEVTQSCLTLCDPMDYNLPGSSVHGIFQARILEWVAISFSRGSSLPRDWTQVSRIVGRRFTIWATRKS